MHDMKGHDMKVHETCSMKTSGPRCTQVTCDHAQKGEGRTVSFVQKSVHVGAAQLGAAMQKTAVPSLACLRLL